MIEFYVASNFVLQWRRWMTASYTSRWLVNSMHYKLALAGETADNPDQRISQDVGGFINGSGTGSNSGNAGIYNYTIQLISAATNLVAFSIILWGLSRGMTVPFFGIEVPGFLFWVATLYAVFATGVTQLIGSRLVGALFPPAAGRGELPLRPRAHTRIQRADRAVEGRDARDRPRRRGVRGRVPHDPAHHQGAHRADRLQPVLFPDLGDHPLCDRCAVLLSPRKCRSARSTRPPTPSATSTRK